MPDFYEHPSFQHPLLSRREMAAICDIANPGFEINWPLGEEMVAHCLVAEVEDWFRLYPGLYEEKWAVDPAALLAKLHAAPLAQLVAAARQVDAFWESVLRSHSAAALGARGGRAGKGKTSTAKARAARRNGKLGGRPRRLHRLEI